MIIQCEKCATRFKVADDKVTPQGIKVRCSKCQHVFTARAGDATSMPSSAASRPSGIFAAPETQSPPSSRSSSSGPPSSGSVSVPQASLRQDASFNPFAPPSAAGAPSSSPSLGNRAGLSFELDDAPPGEDRSFFGTPNQTIGGFDDDDVPPPPPEPAPSPDPFAAALHGGPSPDPFSSHAPSAADQTAAFIDPFGAASGPSAPAAFPVGGDPFGAKASADPFSGAPPTGAAGAPGADPFATDETAPFPPSSGGGSSLASGAPAGGGDPFAGLGVEVEDPYAVDVDEPPPPPPPPAPVPAAPPPSTATATAAKSDAAPEKPAVAKARGRIPPAVPRIAWAVAQACILVAFLTISLVWVRGGSLDDIAEGQALEVVLGRASNAAAGQGPLRVDDVVVARRPVEVAPDLVVVSGYVVNGDVEHPAVRVTVRFGEGKSESAWAKADVDGVDLATAASPEALLALNDRVPDDPAIEPGARAPFAVLLRGAPDGARADVEVESAKPPLPPPVEATPPAPDDAAEKGKKLRRRPRRGEGKGDVESRAHGEAEGARARPRARRGRQQG